MFHSIEDLLEHIFVICFDQWDQSLHADILLAELWDMNELVTLCLHYLKVPLFVELELKSEVEVPSDTGLDTWLKFTQPLSYLILVSPLFERESLSKPMFDLYYS